MKCHTWFLLFLLLLRRLAGQRLTTISKHTCCEHATINFLAATSHADEAQVLYPPSPPDSDAEESLTPPATHIRHVFWFWMCLVLGGTEFSLLYACFVRRSWTRLVSERCGLIAAMSGKGRNQRYRESTMASVIPSLTLTFTNTDSSLGAREPEYCTRWCTEHAREMATWDAYNATDYVSYTQIII